VTPAGYALTPVLSNDPNTDFDANNTPQAVVSNNNTNNTIDFASISSATARSATMYGSMPTRTAYRMAANCPFPV